MSRSKALSTNGHTGPAWPRSLSGMATTGLVVALSTDLSRWTAEEIAAGAATVNSRPRKILGWKTPAEALDEHLRSLPTAGVATTD